MNYESKKLLNLLIKKKIKFSLKSHPAFFTVKESKSLKQNMGGAHTKNLFFDSMELTYKWCECKSSTENVGDIIYASDNQCICGVGKHHYHCPTCGGIEQVG